MFGLQQCASDHVCLDQLMMSLTRDGSNMIDEEDTLDCNMAEGVLMHSA